MNKGMQKPSLAAVKKAMWRMIRDANPGFRFSIQPPKGVDQHLVFKAIKGVLGGETFMKDPTTGSIVSSPESIAVLVKKYATLTAAECQYAALVFQDYVDFQDDQRKTAAQQAQAVEQAEAANKLAVQPTEVPLLVDGAKVDPNAPIIGDVDLG